MYYLTKTWMPGIDYEMPFSWRKKNGVHCKCKLSKEKHLVQGIAYSYVLDGLLCVPCVLFDPSSERGSDTNSPVKEPVLNYVRLLGTDQYLTNHWKLNYHKLCAQRAEDFMNVFSREASGEGPSDICSQVDARHAQKVVETRNRLIPIIDIITMCGEMNDDAVPLSVESPPPRQQGVFRRMVYERARFDDNLRHHLKTMPGNARYLSPQIQNEVLDIAAEEAVNQILSGVREACFFSVFADETSDISRMEQFAVALRYVHDSEIRECLASFENVTSCTGRDLADTILKRLGGEGLNLGLTKLVGQGYDGASNMAGKFGGSAVLIQQAHNQATFVHCKRHVLNLSIGKASEAPAVKNSLRTTNTTIVYVRKSPKRNQIFDNALRNHQSCRTPRSSS